MYIIVRPRDEDGQREKGSRAEQRSVTQTPSHVSDKTRDTTMNTLQGYSIACRKDMHREITVENNKMNAENSMQRETVQPCKTCMTDRRNVNKDARDNDTEH